MITTATALRIKPNGNRIIFNIMEFLQSKFSDLAEIGLITEINLGEVKKSGRRTNGIRMEHAYWLLGGGMLYLATSNGYSQEVFFHAPSALTEKQKELQSCIEARLIEF